MRKFIIILLVAVVAFSLCACKESKNSKYDKEKQLRDQIVHLEDEYDNAKQKADQFKEDVNDYYNSINSLDRYN